MGRRGTELETRFTGDDRDLQAKLGRNIKGAKEFGTAWQKAGDKSKKSVEKTEKALGGLGTKVDKTRGKMKKLAAASGVGLIAGAAAAGAKSTSKLVDKLILAQRAGADFKRFQALAEVFKAFRIEADDTSETILEVSRAIGEAKQDGPESTKATAFKQLGLDFEALERLNPVERVLALAEAFDQLADKDVAIAALGQLLGDDVSLKLKPVFQLGAEEITKRVADVPVRSLRQAAKAQEQEAAIRRAKQKSGAGIGGVASGLLGRGFGTEKAELDPEGAKAVLIPPEAPDAKRDAKAAAEVIKETVKKGGTSPFNIPALLGLDLSGATKPGGEFERLDELVELQKKSNDEILGPSGLLQTMMIVADAV